MSGEIPIPSADETLTPPEILSVPSGSTPSSSASIPIPPGASSSSGVKRTYSESTALPNSLGVSSGSGVKGAHGDSIVNDVQEQPGTRARISALIAGLHGVNAAEDEETDNGRKEMERFQRMKVYRVVTRGSMERDGEEKMISIKWVITNKGTEEHPIAEARNVAREFNTGDKRGEFFGGTPGSMAMRTVISRAMTKCENGARRSMMLADVKTAFLFGDARRSLFVELPPEKPLAAFGRYVGKLERAMYGTRDAPMSWQDHLWKTN